MTSLNNKLTVIVTIHNEGIYIGPCLQSANMAISEYEKKYGNVEKIIGVDNPTKETQTYLNSLNLKDWHIFNINFKDISLVRNYLVSVSSGDYIAFLDGDDLFSSNWLLKSMDIVLQSDENLILHPEINWIFDSANHVWYLTGSDSPLFNKYYFYIGNYYDALCFSPRNAYIKNPFVSRSGKQGFGYEDWTWALDTYCSGYKHSISKDTVIFKRRRSESVSTFENSNNFIRINSEASIDKFSLYE